MVQSVLTIIKCSNFSSVNETFLASVNIVTDVFNTCMIGLLSRRQETAKA